MTIITPKLKLRRPESTDDFDIADFQFNYDLLEAAPGIAIGLSSGRPTWDAGQAGRLFLETDTRRVIEWTGSAWVDLGMPGESFSGYLTSPTLNTSMGANITRTFNFPAITLTRPARLVGSMSVNWRVIESKQAFLTFKFLVDSANAHVYDIDVLQRDTGPSTTLYNYGSSSLPIRSAVLQPGVHTPKFQVASGNLNEAFPYLAMYSLVASQ